MIEAVTQPPRSTTADRLRLGVAQIACVPGDIDANAVRHLDAIRRAREGGVDLLVFPELSLADYVSHPDLARVGVARDHPIFDRLAEAAGPMALAIGFVERIGSHHYIATAVIDGGTMAVHRKLNLATYGQLVEGHHYTPGRALDLIHVKGWSVSVLICADAWNPALPWLAAVAGAELMIIPVASALDAVDGPYDNPTGWQVTLQQLAITYGLPVVMANHCGTRGNLRFWGGSRVIDPFGRELVRASHEPQFISAIVERKAMTEAQAALPTVRDADPDHVHRLLGDRLAALPRGAQVACATGTQP